MSARISLKLSASKDALVRINDAIEHLGEREEWPMDFLFTVNLVLEELVLNIVNHAYGGSGGKFEVVMNSQRQALTVELIDDGPPFNVLDDAPEPDVDAAIEDRQIGGLGVHLVKSMVDELDYERVGGKNRLVFVKRRSDA